MIAADIQLQGANDIIAALIAGPVGKVDHFVQFKQQFFIPVCAVQAKNLHFSALRMWDFLYFTTILKTGK